MKKYLALLFITISTLIFAQSSNQSELSLDNIMKGNEFIGVQPSGIFWSENSKTIYFKWNPDAEPNSSLYKYELSAKKISKVSIDEERSLMNTRDYDYSSDKSKKVYVKHGDVYLYDAATNSSKELIITFDAYESGVSFAPDNKSIIFKRENNLFRFDLDNGQIAQLTNFKTGSKKKKNRTSEQDQWLKEQQYDLFEVLQDRKERKDLSNEHSEALRVQRPKEIYLNGKYLSNITIGENGKYIAYRLSEYPKNKNTMTPHFVSESGYTTEQRTRSKVGGKRPSYELWIYNYEKDSTYKVDVSSLTGIYNKPLYLKEYEDDFIPNYEEPKSISFSSPVNSKNGEYTILEMNSDDNKERWIAQIDFKNGKLIELDHQHDEAWISGPGISGRNIGWLDDETVYYQSEETGYSHLYKINLNSKKIKALTKGNWEVLSVSKTKDGEGLFIVTNEVHPGEYHLYRLNLKNLKREKLTNQTGNNEITISPDEQHFAVRYSYSNKPWELYLLANEDKAKEKQLTESTTEEFNSYNWRAAENITFKAEDGIEVHARMYTPDSGAEGKPLVVFVHGAGYLQNAHKWWSTYYREYMFHNYLVDNGYVVLDIDYRASKGYGRDFRTGIYRHMGGKDMSDQVDGVKHLVDKYGVDKDKVGIYGGSYGGFITIMGMFNYPEIFQSGAAIRSVTDWAHYNHGYTSNILNTPMSDPKAFERSSPINFADGLEGRLLMLHGMVDDNVHFQDVVRLTQKLIELKKDNWDNVLYPVERHGFIESSSWTDEYKRIYKLFEDTLK
ncbi:S9 family peptidase [Urechidicola vernalis]|uniref:Prolyl oligopeptidase family serine peptidase n=1 Tax=Urechidicola vernalis TaxID=3075600 RepID=A0ABU2Y1F5_9FLAO|nr:prolyl oligopeptidase family serine peptidase [Urechidicola sp. P050]MDT0552048.1 prolyl oligopeptidase family serine peptidase [Urechidicola sp. P050]